MTDHEMQLLLPDYLAGRLDPDLSRQIEQRCAASMEMSNALDAARRYTDALGAVEEIRAPDDFLDKVHQRIEEPSGMLHRLFTPIRRWLPVELAGVLVTALLVLFLFNPFSGEIPQLRTSRPVQEYESRQQPAPVSPATTQQEPLRSDKELTTEEYTAQKKSRQSRPSGPNEQVAARVRREVHTPFAAKRSEQKNTPSTAALDATEEAPEYKGTAKRRTQSFGAAAGVASGAAGTIPDHLNEPSIAASPPPAPPAAAPERVMAIEEKVASEISETTDRPQSIMKRKMSAPRRSAARAYSEEQSLKAEAAPFADETEVKPEPAELLPIIHKAVQRYRGSIDTVITSEAHMVSLQITLPSGKLDDFYTRLSRSCSVTIVDTLPESGKGLISVVLEVYE
ncbi:MAG: hypothetical protein JW863_10370 [Chitinispirillaceae bacterium]|nr:hypothetical protein [Chitinispirillaceae bacterium]